MNNREQDEIRDADGMYRALDRALEISGGEAVHFSLNRGFTILGPNLIQDLRDLDPEAQGLLNRAGDFLRSVIRMFPRPLREAVYYDRDHEKVAMQPDASREFRTAHGIDPDEVMKLIEHPGFEPVEEGFRNEVAAAHRRALERTPELMAVVWRELAEEIGPLGFGIQRAGEIRLLAQASALDPEFDRE